MTIPPLPENETARLAVLEQYRMGGFGREPAFDRIAAQAARLFDTPIGLVSLINRDDQCFKGALGLSAPGCPRDFAFCAFTILSDQPMIVPDARLDPRFSENPLVADPPHVRFYAGAPLRVRDGFILGALCILDTRPRTFSETDQSRLAALAETVVDLIEMRVGSLTAEAERIRAEEAERRMAGILDAMPAALAVYGKDDRLSMVNRSYRETFFPDNPEFPVIGSCFETVLREMSAHGLNLEIEGNGADWIERRLALRRKGGGSYEIRLPGGRWLSSLECRTPAGDLVAINTDISELKAREIALVEYSSLLRATIESVDHAIAVFDQQDALIVWNDEFFDMLRAPPDLHRRGAEMDCFIRLMAERGDLGPGDPKVLFHNALAHIREGHSRRAEIRTIDGRVLDFRQAVTIDGRTVVSFSDITERKEIERIKDEFISTVSHELRTPLTSITGSLGLLARGIGGELPAKAVNLIGIAHKNGERLNRLINDLLDIDRIESGQMEFHREPVDICALLAQSVEQNRPYAERFGVNLDLKLSSYPTTVMGDSDRLLQVAANLISNAVKHSPSDGTVTILVKKCGAWGRFEVRDNGSGISEGFRARIFQRFAQADSSDRRSQGGTGLGLSIARSIVERHGGAIGFETRTGEGSGTVFHVDLPLAASEPPRSDDVRNTAGILICEDSAPVASAIRALLARAGFDSDIVATVAEARNHLRERAYHALVLDLMLPDGNGVDLIRELRADDETRAFPIVVVSATANEARCSTEGGALNVVDWFEKPFDGNRLVEVVRRVVDMDREAPRILHVEDDPDIRELVTLALGGSTRIDAADTLEGARRRLAEHRYALIILDVTLPDGSGLDLLPVLGGQSAPPPPVVIFSAADSEPEIIRQVTLALTKSRTPIDKLAEAIQHIIKPAIHRTSGETAP
jgi:signal transduction histidine kinase/DNA-binding response OmpR family regulator